MTEAIEAHLILAREAAAQGRARDARNSYSELPVVLVDVQRSGPSTGMPTRTQQSDFISAAYASHGDTKDVLLIPSTPTECFDMMADAFDYAEKLQTPVIVMSDLDLGMNDHMTPLHSSGMIRENINAVKYLQQNSWMLCRNGDDIETLMVMEFLIELYQVHILQKALTLPEEVHMMKMQLIQKIRLLMCALWIDFSKN